MSAKPRKKAARKSVKKTAKKAGVQKPAAPTAGEKAKEATSVEAGQLARLFELSPTRIAQLGKSGVLVKSEKRGRYLLWPSIQGYIRQLKNPRINSHGTADGTESPTLRTRREKKLDLECEKLQIQIDVENRRLIPINEAVAAASQFAMTCRKLWEGVEDELPPILEGLSSLEMQSRLRDVSKAKIMEMHEAFPAE